MAVEAYMFPQGDKLHPADPEASEAVSKLKGPVLVTIRETRERSLRQHRLYRALLKIAADHAPRPSTPDHIAFALKCLLGYCDWVYVKGKMHPVPRSTSFANMGQVEFQKFFSEALEVALAEYMPKGTSRDALVQQIEEHAR